MELEAWRLRMTGHPLDTSGQKWTEPGMSPIVRRAIVATAATTASRQAENPLSVRANLWISNIVWLAVEANLCQPKTDLRILHLSIVASRQLKDSNLLA